MRKHDLEVFLSHSGKIGLVCRVLYEDNKVEEAQKFYKDINETDEAIIDRADKWAIDRIYALEARDVEANGLKTKLDTLSAKIKERK